MHRDVKEDKTMWGLEFFSFRLEGLRLFLFHEN